MLLHNIEGGSDFPPISGQPFGDLTHEYNIRIGEILKENLDSRHLMISKEHYGCSYITKAKTLLGLLFNYQDVLRARKNVSAEDLITGEVYRSDNEQYIFRFKLLCNIGFENGEEIDFHALPRGTQDLLMVMNSGIYSIWELGDVEEIENEALEYYEGHLYFSTITGESPENSISADQFSMVAAGIYSQEEYERLFGPQDPLPPLSELND